MPASITTAPNLEELLGTALAQQLIQAAGGLVELSRLTDGALRHLGAEKVGLSGRAKQLHCGYLMNAPLFVQFFGDDEVGAADLAAAQKALAMLGKRCALVVKTDVSGGSDDGSFGAAEREKLRPAFGRLLAEKKVSTTDTQALPVPEVHKRGEAPKRKRGGMKEFRKREAQSEVPSVVQQAFSRVKMGISEEQQREELLQRNDLRVAYIQEQEERMARETRKRRRAEDSDDEYGDLLHIAL